MLISTILGDEPPKRESTGVKRGHLSTYGLVRDLRPEDALSVAAIHSAAFPETRLSVLGIRFLEQYYRCHFGSSDMIHLGIELHNEIVGFACGGQQGYHKLTFRKVKAALARAVLRHPLVIYRLWCLTFHKPNVPLETARTESESQIISLGSLPPPIFVLRIIAVDESVRNTGCAKQLLTEFEERAKSRGACSIFLSVLKSNFSARRLYARFGMFPVSENQTPSAMSYGKSLGV